MKIKIKNKEIREALNVETPEFPKYVTQIINLANQNSQGTRPKNVGQMSELIKVFPGKEIEEWKKWYIEKHPEAIQNATQKILAMVDNFKEAIALIDKKMIEKWVKDLVFVQTFLGLSFQKALLKKIAEIKNTTYRVANEQEESRGVDGFIGDIPVSIKPETYKIKMALPENLEAKIIFYSKVKDGMEADFDF